MLVPRSLSRSKILVLIVVLILAVVGGLYLTSAYLLSSPGSTTGIVVSKFSSGFGPELEAALNLPEPATVFDPAWFDESLMKQLQNDGTLPVKVGQSGKADPFAPLNSILKKK
jgi:hypothetical protein